jgi:SAM-dependent methyltransferase
MQRRDGFEPADLAPFIPLLRRWRQPLRSLVTLPALLEKTGGFDTFRPRASEEFAAYAVRRLLRSTRELLRSLSGSRYGSRWSNYVHTSTHYKSADQDAKQAFVESALAAISPSHVLDVGANSGVYSRIAAHAGAEVVAWDTDVEASDLNWQWARREGLRILPIVADFARPAPAVGWRNEESASLLDRAKGRFDFVLMLGILHHLLIADQIPLEEILAQLWEISSRWAIVEWISREDPQFESLCRGRQELYSNLSEEFFLHALEKCCAIRKQARLPNGRILCLVEKCS